MSIKETIQKKNSELNRKHFYNKQTWISITNIKDACKIPFDRDSIAQKTYDNHYEDEGSEYYHMSVEQIIEKWEDKASKSRQNGNFCDSYIEYFYNDKSEEEKNHFKTTVLNESQDMERKLIGIENCLRDFKSKNFVFEAREMKLMLPYEYKGKTYVINGRFDAIFSNSNKIILIDWKNSEDIKSENKWQKMLGPCKNMDDCDMNLFTIQLYVYKYILHHVYGIEKDILSYIIQFPSHKDYYYKVFSPSFEYDEKLIQKIIEHSIEERIKA